MSTTYCMLCRKRTSGRNVSVPRDESRRELWSRSTGVQFTSSSRICASHFNDSDFFYYPSENATKRRRLMPNAVPQKLQDNESFTEHKTSTCGKNLFDFNSQTEQDVVDSGIAIENLRLQKQVSELKKENMTLLKKLQEMQTLSDSLRSIFTESQVRKLQNGGKRIKWNQDDMSYASCLHAAGPRAYRHLFKKGFPLPCQSTLEKWLHSIEVKPGILELVIDLMEKAVNIDEKDKICILSFDEMRITSSCENDSSQGGVQQPRDYVQVTMAQGLRKSWKQPIYFDFDKAMSVPTLHMLIQKLYTIGYYVVGIVSDMCPTNLRLWTNLGVSHEKTWFKHPSDSDMKVFVFADAAHLLKLIRNHFLDSGLVVGDKLITQQTVRQVMSHASLSDISNMWKVNEDHLNVRYAGRQKIKLATQLLSNSTASAIRRCQTLGIEIDNASETADFIQLSNDWFDIFNVKLPASKSIPTKQPFGQSIDAQRKVLDEMTALMSKIIIPNGKKCWPFQKGMIISNTSLYLLHQYAAKRYSVDHLITGRLSLDQLDQFFDVIWEKNDLHDHPTASEIKLRLRKYLLGNSCLRLDVTEEDIDIKIEQKELTTTNEDKEKECYPESPEDYTSSSSCRDQDELADVSVQSELLGTEAWELSEGNLEIKIEENELVPIESEHNVSSSEIQNHESKLFSNLQVENVAQKNRFQCPQCSKISEKCSHFDAHIRTHTSEQCPKEFALQTGPQFHLSTHPGEQINKCPHCGQYFIDSDELVEHIRIHTGERTYSCTECSKEFGYAWQLETHIRKHTGEQPFKCPHCPQTCKNIKDLIKHIESSHSRQRLHKCPQCPKAFISVSNFKEHIKSHCIKSP